MKTAVLLGAGGLGCPAALALAEEKDGLRLIIVDPDRIERSNLARQILYGEADIGAAKAEIAARRTGAEARVERFDEATPTPTAASASRPSMAPTTSRLASSPTMKRFAVAFRWCTGRRSAGSGSSSRSFPAVPPACVACSKALRTSRPPARTPVCSRRYAAWSALPWRARLSLSCAASPMQACSTAGTRAPAGTVLSR